VRIENTPGPAEPKNSLDGESAQDKAKGRLGVFRNRNMGCGGRLLATQQANETLIQFKKIKKLATGLIRAQAVARDPRHATLT